METCDYANLIPKSPPKGIVKWLKQTRNYWECGVLKYKQVSREEADAYTYHDDFFADIRAGADAEKLRPALLYCTECNRYMLAGYIPAKGCHGYGVSSGVQLLDSYWQEGTRFQDGEAMLCPGCGATVKLRSTTSMRYGQTEEHFVVVPTVKKNLLALTEWRIARHFSTQLEESWSFDAFCSYIYDGGRLHRLVNWRCGMMGCYYQLETWEEPKRMVDTLGAPVFYTEDMPSLEGTELENAKLWDYARQACPKDLFYPVAYLRLYRRRPAVENLITAGMGMLLGQAIAQECERVSVGYNGIRTVAPKLSWMNWKERQPAKILGLDRAELRQAAKEQWTLKKLQAYRTVKADTTLADFELATQKLGLDFVERFHQAGAPLARTVRYLQKQQEDPFILLDYWDMADRLDLDLQEAVIRWPPHLRGAHDRAASQIQYQKNAPVNLRFAAMTERCRGLAWEHDGICIRPAESVEELVQEGKTLHHCVGGYGPAHADGRIILFIRHTRRPERSWFTLNVDVREKKILQNHGYGNEYAHGRKLTIPRAVQDFVALWKREVLDKWTLPKPKNKAKPRTGESAA